MSLSANNNKKIISSAFIGFGFAIATFASAPSFAGCYFVTCPNAAPPPAPVAYIPQPISQSVNQESEYSRGYKDGLRNGTRTITKTKIIYRSKSVQKLATKAKPIHQTVTKKHVVAKPAISKVSKKSVARIYTSNHGPTNQVKYASNSADTMRNYAATYSAAQYGSSVPLVAVMGRGEQWVSSNVRIVRYATPHTISNHGGKNCGWGTPIASNGQYLQSRAWVCQCEQGWLPPR